MFLEPSLGARGRHKSSRRQRSDGHGRSCSAGRDFHHWDLAYGQCRCGCLQCEALTAFLSGHFLVTFLLKIEGKFPTRLQWKSWSKIVSKTFRLVWNALWDLQPFVVLFGESVFHPFLVRRFGGNLTRGATCSCMFDGWSPTIIRSRPMIAFDVTFLYVTIL